jgi:Ni,Fe-hydrogenase III large subunit
MVLKRGHFGKQIRNTWKVLKCGAGKGRTERVRKEVLHGVKEEKNIVHTIKIREANWMLSHLA